MRTDENSNGTFLPQQLIDFSIRTLSRKTEIHPHDGVRRAKSNMSNNKTFVRSQAEIMAHSPRRELVDGQKLLFASKTGPMQRHDASTPVPKDTGGIPSGRSRGQVRKSQNRPFAMRANMYLPQESL